MAGGMTNCKGAHPLARPSIGVRATSVVVAMPACVWPQWGVALPGLANAYPTVLTTADSVIKLLGEYGENNKD